MFIFSDISRFLELKELLKVMLMPYCRFAYLRPPSCTEVWNLKISAIFNFEITWAGNSISLANWLISLSPIHKFAAHGEESVFRGQKYQTWQIFSIQPCAAKFSRKLRRTREETAEETAFPGNLVSCFLSCSADLKHAAIKVNNYWSYIITINILDSDMYKY